MTLHSPPPTPTLEARDLTLRPIDPDGDASRLHVIFGDAEQLKFMLRPPCASVSETAALLAEWGRDPWSPQWAVERTGVIVGRITLVKQRAGVFEVGIQVAPEAQGHGVATHAILAVTPYAFAALDACRVFADIDPGNVRCSRAFRRAGYRFEGTLLATWKTDRGVFDSEIFAATAGWTSPDNTG